MADTITGTVYGEYSKDWRLRVDYTATPNYSTLKYDISAKLYIYKPFSTRSWNLDGSPYYRLLSNTNRTFRFDFDSGIGWYQIGSAQTATASAGSYTITAYWYFDLPEESYRPLSLSLSSAISLPTIGVASQPSVKMLHLVVAQLHQALLELMFISNQIQRLKPLDIKLLMILVL